MTSATPTAAGSGPAAPATPASGASGPAAPAGPGDSRERRGHARRTGHDRGRRGRASGPSGRSRPLRPRRRGQPGRLRAAPAAPGIAGHAPGRARDPGDRRWRFCRVRGATDAHRTGTRLVRAPGPARPDDAAGRLRGGGRPGSSPPRSARRNGSNGSSNRTGTGSTSSRRSSSRRWEEAEYFLAENQDAEARAGKREKQLDEAKARVARLEEQLRSHGHTPLPNGWGDFVGWCERELAGSLVLSPRARREIKGARFADTPLAARCVLWLASEYRDGRLNGAGASLRIEESGIRNEPCGGDKVPLKWGGANRFAGWHLKNGGNTRDPARCLRIYYLWDEETRQVVIASMPAHVRSALT